MIEIERKFLVKNTNWKALAFEKSYLKQGYLINQRDKAIRVRIAAEKAFLTIKADLNLISRYEFEYEIPLQDANLMLDMLSEKPLIEKYRCLINFEGFLWEVDEFLGENEGLVVAEIELKNETQNFSKPDWIGEEITQDTRYINANLVKNPFSKW